MRKLMFSLCIISFLSSCGLSVAPTKTTVTYGESSTTNDTAKDAKNDSTTTSDSEKQNKSIIAIAILSVLIFLIVRVW